MALLLWKSMSSVIDLETVKTAIYEFEQPSVEEKDWGGAVGLVREGSDVKLWYS